MHSPKHISVIKPYSQRDKLLVLRNLQLKNPNNAEHVEFIINYFYLIRVISRSDTHQQSKCARLILEKLLKLVQFFFIAISIIS